MQVRIRKTRSTRRSRQARIGALSSFALIFTLLISCSSLQSRKKDLQQLGRSLGKICLDGDGKGRMEFTQGRYLFRYESEHDQKKNELALGISVPMQEYEVLRLNYEEILTQNKMKASGKFYQRMLKEMKGDKSALTAFQQYLSHLGLFLELVNQAGKKDSIYDFCRIKSQENETIKGVCRLGVIYDEWQFTLDETHLKFYLPISENYSFEVDNFAGKDKFYARQVISMRDKRISGAKRQPMVLRLFVTSCTSQ